jgi:hypothetical protein
VVNKADALKEEQSIPAKSAKNLGKTLFEESVHKAKAFYEDDEFFWMCTGKKIYIYCLHPVVYYYIVLLYNHQHNRFVINKPVLLY